MAGNALAHAALLLWFPLALVVATLLSPLRTFLVIMLGGILLLPERLSFDFPLIPPLDKHAISALSVLIALLLTKPRSLLAPHPSKATRYVFLALAVSAVCTAQTNRDPLVYGPVAIAGLSNHDVLSMIINDALGIVLPFYLAHSLIRTTDDLRELLKSLVLAALFYVPFIFAEVRLSPFFHTRLYGFFQHQFAQAMRGGGFRPFVFMAHGLAVALFVSQALIASRALGRLKQPAFSSAGGLAAALVLAVALVTCKSMGAFIYAFLGAPLAWFASAHAQLRAARWLAIFVFSYPLARTLDLISIEWFVRQARYWSTERALSLEFRFHHEIQLLSKAQERVYFGWGGWGRNLVFDPLTGQSLSVTDGEWIIQLGCGGALRFIIIFGLLLGPVLMAHKASALLPKGSDAARLLALLALLLAFGGLDLLPNAIFHPLPYVMAGGLTSVCAGIALVPLANRSTNDREAPDVARSPQWQNL